MDNSQFTRCPFPVGAIYITVDPAIPSGIRPGTFRVPFKKGRAIVCVNDESETLKTPWHEFGSATVPTKTISEWEEWSTTVMNNEWFTNYQPSVTAYIRKRVRQGDPERQKYNAFNITEEQIEDRKLYWDNAIYDYIEESWELKLRAKQPDPYNP